MKLEKSLLGLDMAEEDSPENNRDGIRTARRANSDLIVLTRWCEGGSTVVGKKDCSVQTGWYCARMASMEHGPLWLQNRKCQSRQARHEELRNDDEYVVYTLGTAYVAG